ncbi:MAG: CHRD domain-containing protein [Saprospiraceae bacterium]|nr:CHRD domain-containing protein [Saprospiraceae bacterium]
MKKSLLSQIFIITIITYSCILDAQTFFTATLTADQENPSVVSTAKGTGVFLLTDQGLKFNITVDGLNITNAHFHSGKTGLNGGVVRGILPEFKGSTANGIWTSTDSQPLTTELISELLAGNLYVNIHTAANGGGEIRGQVLLSSGTSFTANLNGDQENPAIVTSAKGTGTFTLTDEGLLFAVSVEGTGIANAHFHSGKIGANGGVVRGILPEFKGGTAVGIWKKTDSQPLTAELIKSLLLGDLYVNVHSSTNPGGEIRGQVNLNSGMAFSADINGEQSVPSVASTAKGTASFTLTDAGLIYNITLTGLKPTNAHFHKGAAGANGGVVRGLFSEMVGNSIRGVWTSNDAQPLTKELIADLLKGNLYVNFHTPAFPGGEIRGQVLPNSGTSLFAKINGEQSNPSVVSIGGGTAYFILTDTGLIYNITVDSIDITNAHFHKGGIGANGGVVRGLFAEFNGNHVSGIWKSTDTQPLTADLVKDLLLGNIYVNFHTAANPGGEIRGQVLLSSGTGLNAYLNGAQSNPAITTNARGTASFTLTPAGLIYAITLDSLEITNAHFHKGGIGANGGVVRGLFSEFTGKSVSGIWTSTDTQPLTPELVKDLLSGNIYVNIHTAANPGGEIRGQVLLNEGIGFSAKIEGQQEVPSVTTNASGTGAFSLTNAGLIFNTTLNGLTIANAHFHNAAYGANGPVVRGILPEFIGTTASGLWASNDAQPLTNAMRAELILGNIYINAHTAGNPGGEVRGQLSDIELVTGVDDFNFGNNNSKNLLYQNAPNPFGGYTDISFEINKSGHTNLSVYDLLGNKITTILNERLDVGSYKVSLDANSLPSGMYIYKLEANGKSESLRMILQK